MELHHINANNGHEEHYAKLTSSSAGMIDHHEQLLMREAGVLIAGCGAIGGHTIEALARCGFETFTIADHRLCDSGHLGRMPIGASAIGRNRAEVMAEHIAAINPYAEVLTIDTPLDDDVLADVLDGVSIVIDTLGIRTNADILARHLLHRMAQEYGLPVISGFDVVSAGWTLLYDYRDSDQQLLDGQPEPTDLDPDAEADSIEVLSQMISLSRLPLEVLREADQLLAGQRLQLPRLGFTAQLASAMVCQTVLDLLFDRPLRRIVSLDLASAARPASTSFRDAGKRLVDTYALRRRLRNRRSQPVASSFSPLDDRVFQDLRAYMDVRTYEPESVILRQGEPPSEFFTIISGQVRIEYENDDGTEFEVVAELGPGDYFGEIALLADCPRIASAVVAERCDVYVLSRNAFEIYLQESPIAAARIRALAQTRQDERAMV